MLFARSWVQALKLKGCGLYTHHIIANDRPFLSPTILSSLSSLTCTKTSWNPHPKTWSRIPYKHHNHYKKHCPTQTDTTTTVFKPKTFRKTVRFSARRPFVHHTNVTYTPLILTYFTTRIIFDIHHFWRF